MIEAGAMTPTDIPGWIAFLPKLIPGAIALGVLTIVVENTERGRRIADRVIGWILR